MPYMLDTNICIHLIQRHPPQVLQRLSALKQGEALMSVVTYAELRAGLEMQQRNRDHDEKVLALLVQRIPVLPFTEAAAEQFGILRAAIRDRRRDALDRLIAAHAIAVGAALITNNEADFRDYPGLKLENWVAA
ncbi:MAG: type II toxin-antitoxin system VapC family toxin [Betaproteobacteria bacterium]|nr:MAG: type II toxin-antitoxin system VapC family toxin [Betaproteobacteria bacterium]